MSNRRYEYVCAQCGQTFMAKIAHARFCSVECRSRASRRPARRSPKRCEVCGDEYLGTKAQRVCSNRCKAQLPNCAAEQFKKLNRARRIPERQCPACGRFFRPRGSTPAGRPRRLQRYCSLLCRIQAVIAPRFWADWINRWAVCRYCGERFFQANKHRQFCCKRCGENYYAAQRMWFYTHIGHPEWKKATGRDYDCTQVFGPDDWVCHLCGLPTDKAARCPHPLAAVVDHLQPVSQGGRHVPGNCRTAHNACNSCRGNRQIEHPAVYRANLARRAYRDTG